MARALAQAGADVALHASRPGRPPPPPRSRPSTASATRASSPISSTATAVDALVPGVLDRMGRLDILVNNAGIIRRADAVDYSDADWDAVLEVNLSSVFRLCRAAGRAHAGAGRRQDRQHRVAAVVPGRHPRAGLCRRQGRRRAADQGARERVGGEGRQRQRDRARATCAPTTRARCADDPMRYRQILDRIPAGRWGEPDDLGGAVVFLASTASDYVHGHVLVVDGGWMGR